MSLRMLAAAAVAFAALALAQSSPPLIRLHRTPDTLKSSTPYVHANPGVTSLSLVPVTGPRDVWQVELHGSFGMLEEADKAFPIGYNTDLTRTSIAFHRNWWSTRPEEAFQALRRARYVQVTVIRIPVQAESELNELLRGRRASLDSINIDRPDLVYQVLSGDQSGTFLIFRRFPHSRFWMRA